MAVRDDFAPGEVLAAADLNDTFAAKQDDVLTTKGDIVAYGTDVARLGVGSNGQVLTADSGETLGIKWGAAAGKILQVVYGAVTVDATNSTNTYADTGLLASITPSSATSKVLVFINQAGVYKGAGNTSSGVDVRLLRGATEISLIAGSYGITGISGSNNGAATASFLDEPATTSSTTYKTQFRNAVNAASVTVQGYNARSTMILMEVAA